jgi:hypothetical protein
MSMSYMLLNQGEILDNFLDESFPDWYTGYTQEERIMFNPMEILDKKFTVTFTKQDGTIRELTGVLVEASKYTKDYIFEYCAGLLDKNLVTMVTDQGFKSFIVSNVIKVEIK